MKNSIEKRLHALEALAKESNNGLFTAVYKDGRRRIVTPLEALAICNTSEAWEISSFEGATGSGNGILVEVVNYILHGEDGKENTL